MCLEIKDSNISDVLTNKIVLIDFNATWCGPCRVLGPLIDELSDMYGDNDSVVIGKLDVDANPSSALNYGIRSIPMVIIFKDGLEVNRLSGVNKISEYDGLIKSYL